MHPTQKPRFLHVPEVPEEPARFPVASPDVLPAGWQQLARPARWPGLHLRHLIGGTHEGEFFMASHLVISLVQRAATRCESMRFGRWRDLGIRSGTLALTPHRFGDRVRSTGRTEALNLWLEPGWMDGMGARGQRAWQRLDQPVHGLRDPVMASLLGEIYRENEAGAPTGRLYSESLVLALLCRLAAVADEQRVQRRALDAPRVVGEAIAYIGEHLDAPLSIHAIAAQAGFDGDLPAFSRQFRRLTGQTPYQYVLAARLDRARGLLRSGRHTATEVAMACGFASLSHFSDACRRKLGCPPSALMPARRTGPARAGA